MAIKGKSDIQKGEKELSVGISEDRLLLFDESAPLEDDDTGAIWPPSAGVLPKLD